MKRLLLLAGVIVAALVILSAGYVLAVGDHHHATAGAERSQLKVPVRRLASASTTSSAAIIKGYLRGTEALSWGPIANATGYALFRDGTQVSTAGAFASSANFSIASGGQHTLEARAIFTPPPSTTTATTTTAQTTTASTTTVPLGSSYDSTVIADSPVAYWTMSGFGSEFDQSGNGHTGTYVGGTIPLATMPNGDLAADFNGSSQSLDVPTSPAFSISTTHQLTWEAWIRPDVLQFPSASDGYADWMGKCANYSPTCEWESRMYSTTNPEGRCNRFSAYVFNPGAGLGSGSDWQPTCGLIKAGQWYLVEGEYQTLTTPSACDSAYPGTINIWVDGIQQSFASHAPTGCMSQYSIKPVANNSQLRIGTMAGDYWFSGAIGKVAIYNKLLTQAQINSHYTTMTGLQPSGSCGNTCTIP